MRKYLFTLLLLVVLSPAVAQDFNQIDEDGNVTQRSENRNFNPHNNDTTRKSKVVPKGIYVWTIDRKFGDIRPTEVDTVPHLYPNTTLTTGIYGDFNTLGNNYTARQNRIIIDRPVGEQFIFTQPYDFFIKEPDKFHFTNTLSPITNLSYDNCGDKVNGEDHIAAKFAVNAGKRVGIGFDADYAYARGYFSDQSTSHFGAAFYSSYLGDQYKAHIFFSTYHQKASENGGITNDNYVTHPESYEQTYTESEIPTVLSLNWNRNDHHHLLLSHRYCIGFYHKTKMTEEELKARQFAKESKKEKEKGDGSQESESQTESTDSLQLSINVMPEEPEDSMMKRDFVPVTSIIHTLEWNNYDRTYLAYGSSTDYYANTYFLNDKTGRRDSLSDETKHIQLKNTLALALLEGFNKWAKAGLKVFATHELRTFQMADSVGGLPVMQKTRENNISLGGQIIKSQGQTLHYNAQGEVWMIGEDAGQLKLDFNTDLNFRLFGDTLTLAAHAHFYRLNPTFYQRQYHSKHFWWNNDNLDKESRTRIEGIFSYRKTKTSLRVAVEEIQNYTYLGMNYLLDENNARKYLSANISQHGSNINLLTAQLRQHLKLSIVNWENIITYQNSSNTDILPVPTLNIFSNLYLDFKIAKVLSVELGGNATFFTEYEAPDFCPQLNQFAVQENPDSRVKLGNYPFVNVYANLHLKHARFFVMYNNVVGNIGNKRQFLTPHYPTNKMVLHLGVSWNFFN